MRQRESLRETVPHGTKERPLQFMEFRSGAGTEYPERFFVERHWHHHVELLYIERGTYEAELDLESWTLRTGDICIVNSGVLHELRGLETGTRHEVILFEPQILNFQYEDAFQQELAEPLTSGRNVLLSLVHPSDEGYDGIQNSYRRLVELCRAQEDWWYMDAKLELMGLLLRLDRLGRIVPSDSVLSASEKEKIDRYKRLVSYMESHFSERITLERLAEEVPCNPQYLCHFFREIAGMSPVQYLIHYRIERAKQLLKDSVYSVLEISMECGFDNVSYFIRQFKKLTGMTPGEYRRSVSGN